MAAARVQCEACGVYEAIFFDFDGVLVDSEPIHYQCWCEILASHGMEMSWEIYREKGIGVSDRAMIEFLCSLREPPLDAEHLYAEYPRKKAMFRDRMVVADAITAETRAMLDGLHGQYRLAVVSSSNSSEVEPILEAAGIRHHFDTVVCGNHVQRLKPAPDPYLLAAERLGVKSALVVEDSEPGEVSGRAAGFDVLRVASQASVPELVLSVTTTRT